MKKWLCMFVFLLCAVRGLCTAYGSWDSFSATSAPVSADITVNGWGADSASGTGGVVANVYVDGNFVIQVSVNQPRNDVAAAYGRSDFLYSGYSASFSTEHLSLGTHTVDIWVGGGPSGWNHFTTSISNGNAFTVTQGVTRPTISWVNASDGVRFPAASTNYTVQAVGHSDTGTLASVNVWKDGAPFAFDAPNNSSEYYDKTTDGNWCNDTSGTVHIFSAQAMLNNGQKSPMIYWVAKVGGGASTGLGPITFSDLSISAIVSANPNRTYNPWLPYTGVIAVDSANLNSVIDSLQNDHTAGKVLEFADDTYKFQLSQGASGGFMSQFTNVQSLTLTGGLWGATILNWAIRDAAGVAIDPNNSSYASYFHIPSGGLASNPFPNDQQYQPHGLFRFDNNCSQITISHLAFDTDYTIRVGGEGSHIKLLGSSNQVTDCVFMHATGFAVFLGQGGAANNCQINSNAFLHTWADGVHVLNSNNITVSQNSFMDTGDDAIAVTSEGLAGAGGFTPSVVSITDNNIQTSHWRGILVLGATNVDIEGNLITGVASNGIEAGAYNIPNTTTYIWNNCLQLKNNYVESPGSVSGHNQGTPSNSARGYQLDSIHNLHADFTPPSAAPYHNGQQYAAFNAPLPAFFTNIDNSNTAGTPYSPFSCDNLRYLAGSGGGYSFGAGVASNLAQNY
jgi:hypothetical protein